MILEKRITVINKLGLHARAAAKLVKLTAGFNSVIQLSMAGKAAEEVTEEVTKKAAAKSSAKSVAAAKAVEVDAKSIMGVMMLAATQGSELRLTVRGEDAERAAAAICLMFADCFGEGE